MTQEPLVYRLIPYVEVCFSLNFDHFSANVVSSSFSSSSNSELQFYGLFIFIILKFRLLPQLHHVYFSILSNVTLVILFIYSLAIDHTLVFDHN